MPTQHTLSVAKSFELIGSTVVHILDEHASPLSDAERHRLGVGYEFLGMVDKGRYLMEHPAHVPTAEEEDSILAYRFALGALRLDRCDDYFCNDLLQYKEVLHLLIEPKVPIPANDVESTRWFFERIRVCTAEFLAKSRCCVSSGSTEGVRIGTVIGQYHC